MRSEAIYVKVVSLASALVLCCSAAGVGKSADKITIRVHLFQAALAEGQAGLKQIEVLTTSSRPELAILKDKAAGSEDELTAALMDALLDIYELNTVNDLYLVEKAWNGLGRPNLEDFVFGKLGPFQIKLRPKMLSPQQIALGLDISKATAKSPDTGRLESFLRVELNLTIGDPIVVSAPANDGLYFAMVMAATGKPVEEKPGSDRGKEKKPEMVPAPTPVKQVQPSYPEELRRRSVGGEVGLQVTIDGKGNVTKVDVIKPIHPYLNYTAVQAFKQWTFEPVLHKGKSRIVAFRCGYNFDPTSYVQEAPSGEKPPTGPDLARQDELQMVLGRCGEYCQKLAGAVLDFVCQETIKETHYNLLKNLNWAYLAVGPRPVKIGGIKYIDKSSFTRPSDQQQFQEAAQEGSESDLIEDRGQIKPKITAYQVMDPKETQRNSFVCDYQIVRKAGRAEERRILLKQNGRSLGDRNKTLEEKRFTGLSALFSPLRVIAKDRQSLFDYRLVGDEKVHGNKTYVIKAMPKRGDEDGIWSAKIWVDAKSFQILKCEIEGVPIEGYEDVLNDCVRLNIRPSFFVTHEYKAEKKGVLFPERSTIRAAYSGIDPQGLIPKIVATLNYSKYRYFTVETENQVIK